MTNLRNIIATSAIAVSSNLLASTEFPGNLVPADVAQEFSSGTIYSSLPDNFPTPTLPAGTSLYVLGSVDNTYTQRLLLGTMLTGAEVREILKTGYLAHGWVDLSRSVSTLNLCHDDHGVLNFQMAAPIGDENRILVHRSQRIAMAGPAMSCAEQLAYQNGGPATSPFMIFRESIPVLELPPGTVDPVPTFPFGVSSGSGAGGTYYETQADTTLSIPDYSLDELQEFLAQQMTEQGWTLDGDFVGSKSAAAVWFKTVQVPATTATGGTPIGMLLTAELILLNLKTDMYNFSLRVVTGDPQRGQLGIRGTTSLLPF